MDYSVLIKGLPSGDEIHDTDVNIEGKLKNKIERLGYTVKGMNFIYDTENYLNLKAKYSKNRDEFNKNEYNKEQMSQELGGLTSNFNVRENFPLFYQVNLAHYLLKGKLDEQEENFDSSNPRGMSGAVIVSFGTA